MYEGKKGHIKKRSYINERITSENMRRMLIASLFSVVLFAIMWLFLLVNRGEGKGAFLYYVAMISFSGASAVFAGADFYFLLKRQRNKVGLVRAFWIFCFWSYLAGACSADSQMIVLLNLQVLAGAFAMIPLLNQWEFAVSLISQYIVSVVLCASGRIDFEHFIYLLCAQSLCGIVSRQAYMAYQRKVEDATKLSSVKNQAETDPMTRLLNRRGLERRIAHIWPLCVRQKLSVAVIMLDIDNFKKYNDQFGHPAGDECIKSVAKVLMKQTKRRSDYCARVGGEEFLVALTGISLQEALLWAKECKKAIEDLMIPHAKDNFLPYVTISMGIGYSDGHMTTEFWELRNEADRSLYQAKEEGRACIFMGDKCYAKTTPALNRKQYYIERGFRSLS